MEPPSPSTSRASSSFQSQGLGCLGSLGSRNIGRCIKCNATTFVSNPIAGTCATCRHTLEAAAAAAPVPPSHGSEDGIDNAYDPISSSDDEMEPSDDEMEPSDDEMEPSDDGKVPPVKQPEQAEDQVQPEVVEDEAQPEEVEDKASDDGSSTDSDSTAESAPNQHGGADDPEDNVPPLPPILPKRMISASPVHTVEARKQFAPEQADEDEDYTAEASDKGHAAASSSPRQLFPPVTAKSNKGSWLLGICTALMLAVFGAGVLHGAGEAGVRKVANGFAGRVRTVAPGPSGAASGTVELLAAWAEAATAPLAAKLSAASASVAKAAGKGKPLDEGVAGGTVAILVSAQPEVGKARPSLPQREPTKEAERHPLALASLRAGETLSAGSKYVVAATGAAVLFISEDGVLTLAEGSTPAAAKATGRVIWSADSHCVAHRRVGGPLQRVFRRGPVEVDYSACAAVTASLSRSGRIELRRGKKVVWRGRRSVKAGVAFRSGRTMLLEVTAEGSLELADVRP